MKVLIMFALGGALIGNVSREYGDHVFYGLTVDSYIMIAALLAALMFLKSVISTGHTIWRKAKARADRLAQLKRRDEK